MTTDHRRPNGWTDPAGRMREVSHGHADHDARAWHWFARGPLIVADGGRPADDRDGDHPDRNVEDERIRDVSHEADHDQGANQVWDRGEGEDDAE